MNNYQNVGQYTFTPEAMSVVGEARMAYIRKVYTYFALAVATGIGGTLLAVNTSLVFFFATSPFISLILFLGIVWFAGRSAENPTTALPTLAAATFVSGMVISPMIYLVAGTQGMGAIYSALTLTACVFGGLTLYTWVSRKDFSYMGASLMIGLFLVIGVGIVNMFVQSSTLSLAGAIVSVVLFSGFILYDTSRILRQPHLVPPTLAALSLYLDFLNLFMAILRIVGIGGSSDD
jgi:modulator of FtsH protease